MCRSIKTLRGAEPPATDDEIRAANKRALAYLEYRLKAARPLPISAAPRMPRQALQSMQTLAAVLTIRCRHLRLAA